MQFKDFLSKLLLIEESEIAEFLNIFVFSDSNTFDEAQVKKFLSSLNSEGFTNIGSRLNTSIEECNKKIELYKKNNLADNTNKIDEFKSILNKTSRFISEIGKERDKKVAKQTSPIESALEDNEGKLLQLKEKIDKLEDRIATIDDKNDNKMFTLIINNIAILGIFVAVAFTGFGSVSIVSSIHLRASGDIFKNTYYILLMGFVVYNLLFLLIYFIFKICSFNLQSKQTEIENKISFSKVMQLKPYLIIDVILMVATILMFLLSK